MYAHPFVDMGAGAYYANNFDDSLVEVLQDFFSGKKLHDIYNQSTSTWSTILETKPYDFNATYEMSISRYGKDSYDVAFVGRPGLTISQLYK